MAGISINKTKRLKGQQFYSEITAKKTIFLHHTGGTTADGAISWWNQTPEQVGTAYVIDRDGTIYEIFDPKSWAWSLGIGNKTLERQSIAIEIVAAGFVIPEKDKFYFRPLGTTKGQIEIPKNEVVSFNPPYRGQAHYQNYTDKQVESVVGLLKHLVETFKIEVQPNLKDFYIPNAQVSEKNLPGIWSHTTVLQYKSDIIPQPNFLKAIYKAFEKTSEYTTPKVATNDTPIENPLKNEVDEV